MVNMLSTVIKGGGGLTGTWVQFSPMSLLSSPLTGPRRHQVTIELNRKSGIVCRMVLFSVPYRVTTMSRSQDSMPKRAADMRSFGVSWFSCCRHPCTFLMPGCIVILRRLS